MTASLACQAAGGGRQRSVSVFLLFAHNPPPAAAAASTDSERHLPRHPLRTQCRRSPPPPPPLPSSNTPARLPAPLPASAALPLLKGPGRRYGQRRPGRAGRLGRRGAAGSGEEACCRLGASSPAAENTRSHEFTSGFEGWLLVFGKLQYPEPPSLLLRPGPHKGARAAGRGGVSPPGEAKVVFSPGGSRAEEFESEGGVVLMAVDPR